MGKTYNYRILLFSFFIVTFSIIAVVFLVFFLLWGVLNTQRKLETMKSHEKPFKYKFTQIDEENDESSIGYLSSYLKLEGDESIFLEYDDGSKILISNFETEDYKCSGRCICETENLKRAISAPFSKSTSKSLVYLVGALSSVVAFDKAQDFFKEECELEMDDLGCSKSSVQSVVDDCEDIVTPKKVSVSETDDIRDFSSKFYVCSGTCLASNNMKRGFHISADEKLKCNDLIQSGTVEVRNFEDNKYGIRIEDNLIHLSKAKQEFQKSFLNPFCESQVSEESTRKVYPCVGENDGADNPTIFCRRSHGYGWV